MEILKKLLTVVAVIAISFGSVSMIGGCERRETQQTNGVPQERNGTDQQWQDDTQQYDTQQDDPYYEDDQF